MYFLKISQMYYIVMFYMDIFYPESGIFVLLTQYTLLNG